MSLSGCEKPVKKEDLRPIHAYSSGSSVTGWFHGYKKSATMDIMLIEDERGLLQECDLNYHIIRFLDRGNVPDWIKIPKL